MDHALRTISYIADIGDLLVIMARRRPAPTDDVQVIGTTPKMICQVFESEEVGIFFYFFMLAPLGVRLLSFFKITTH